MKRALKIALKVLLSVIGLIIVLLIAMGLWYRANVIHSEHPKNFRQAEVETISVAGYTFRDLNGNDSLDIYEDKRQPIEARAEDLLSQMSMEEKIRILKGSGMQSAMGLIKPGEGISGAVGTIVPVARLGIPTLYLSDGPAGLRINPRRKNDPRSYYCTAFPIGTLVASTWNTELASRIGDAMGKEMLEYGIDVILGPGANIHRHPLCGRNFEYFSEDPVLTGEIGAAIVNGVEANGVGTCVKHFVANNQETNRMINDVRISERALREIYLKGFEIIVRKAQPWSLMSSYNRLNGSYVAENREILTDILRDDWGFEGVVMTDWFGGSNAVAQVAAGNDLQEPGTRKQYKALKKAAASGELSEEAINTSVKRILKLVLASGKMDGLPFHNDPDLEAHALIARQSAAEGMILLKNEGALPLKQGLKVALFGASSYDFIAGGTGSGDVNEAYSVSLEEGLTNAGFQINPTAKSYVEEYKAAHPEAFRKPKGTLQAMMNPYSPPEIVLSEEQVRELSTTSDLAIVTIGRNAGEGGDRVEKDDFLLSEKEQQMLTTICRVFHDSGKQVVVVLNIGGVIETASWKQKPDAILLAWQGGQEGGNSVANILAGKENPSGKLPMTFPLKLNDHASNANFPLEGGMMKLSDFLDRTIKPVEEQLANIDYSNYEEGIYVGYRHFDKAGLEVSYPFGFGLSYTSFEYSNLEAELADSIIKVQINIQNTGEVAGKEVVQLFSAKPGTKIDRPKQALKAFAKTPLLAPGESTVIEMSVPVPDLAYWNEDLADWTVEPGEYQLLAGASSRDIREQTFIEL